MSWRQFWLIRDNVKKHWKIKLSAKSYTIVSGRKGTDGRMQTKKFSTAEEAQGAYLEIVSVILGKGYREGKEQPPDIWVAIEEGNFAAVRKFIRDQPELINAPGFEGESLVLLRSGIRYLTSG